MARLNVKRAGDSRIVISTPQTATVISGGVKKNHHLSTVLRAMTSKVSGSTLDKCDITPPNTRAYARSGDKRVFVLEDPPTVRTIRWSKDRVDTKVRVSLPWVVYVVGSKAGWIADSWGRLFFRYQPIASLTDGLFFTPLGPTSGTHGSSDEWKGYCCFGSELGIQGGTLMERLKAAVMNVWGSNFYQHDEAQDDAYLEEAEYYLNRGLAVPNYITAARGSTAVLQAQDWHNATQGNPSYGLQHAWRDAGLTVERAINGMMRVVDGPNDDYGYEDEEDYYSTPAWDLHSLADTILRLKDCG